MPTIRAERVAFLVDADAYFQALVAAMVRAERSIVVLGWDIDARTQLPDPWLPRTHLSLRRLVDRLARERPHLHIQLLGWDFAPLFALERLPLPELHLGWRTHARVSYLPDGHHAAGASHHQKVVVIDDRVAFSGGLDLAFRRWDTPAHEPNDPRRRDKYGLAYSPFHDIQVAVSGPAAAALGAIARERWERAGGAPLPPAVPTVIDPWPPALDADAQDAEVEITRTVPALEEGEVARVEVERSIEAMVRAARDTIYIENQYFSCNQLALLLKEALDRPEGPEVILVAPPECSGWLEQETMGMLRRRFLATVRSGAHAATRFRAVAPHVGEQSVFVHAKIMVVDRSHARVGSANWSRRSMAIDTECDVTLVARDRPEHAQAVQSLRDRLLGEHLGLSEADVRARLAADGSVVRLLDGMPQGLRQLRPLADAPPSPEDLTWIASIADPAHPLDVEHVASMIERVAVRSRHGAGLRVGFAAAAVFCIILMVVGAFELLAG